MRFDLLRLLPWLALPSILAGCGALDVVNAVSPKDPYQRTAGIAYGSLERQRLDVYVPAESREAAPLIIFIYGGGWRDGDRAEYAFVASSLTAAGFAVVIPDYRLYPDAVFPDFVEDAAAAVDWAIANADSYGADSADVYIMGHSAGAHIAALLATDEEYLEPYGRDLATFAGFIGLSGPYDFLPIESGYLLEVFPEAGRANSQPIRYASASAPRTLLIHGSGDTTVDPGNSRRFAEALRSAGVDVSLKIYPHVGHGRVVVTLAPPLDFLASTLDDCIAFIEETSALRSSGAPTVSSGSGR